LIGLIALTLRERNGDVEDENFEKGEDYEVLALWPISYAK
jgi:hypothetical protein